MIVFTGQLLYYNHYFCQREITRIILILLSLRRETVSVDRKLLAPFASLREIFYPTPIVVYRSKNYLLNKIHTPEVRMWI